MTEGDKRPESIEVELASGYRQVFTASVAEILSTTPKDAGEIINMLEAYGKFVTLEASYIGDVQEYHGISHIGLAVPQPLRDLILEIYEDPRVIVSRLRLSRTGGKIDVVNPYSSQTPFSEGKIQVKAGKNELERTVSPSLWIPLDKDEFTVYGLRKTLETQETQIVRKPVPGTSFKFPFTETAHHREPIPVTSGIWTPMPITTEILEGFKNLAEDFPLISGASVSVSLPRTDYRDPF